MKDFKIPRIPTISSGKCCHNCMFFSRGGLQTSSCNKHSIRTTAGQCCDDFTEEIKQVEKSAHTRNNKYNIYHTVCSTLLNEKVVCSINMQELLAKCKKQHVSSYTISRLKEQFGDMCNLYIWKNKRCFGVTTRHISDNDIEYLENSDNEFRDYNLVPLITEILYEKYQ